jgi:hypothetical protein
MRGEVTGNREPAVVRCSAFDKLRPTLSIVEGSLLVARGAVRPAWMFFERRAASDDLRRPP